MQNRVKTKKAFTLVELLTVIIIIGILATVATVSYVGAQKVARDNKRKSDLEAIKAALLIYHQDNKTWSLPGVADGFYNAGSGAGPYLVSHGYLSSDLLDPLMSNSSDTSTSSAAQYKMYVCYSTGSNKVVGVALLAKLESISGTSFDSDLDALCFSPSGETNQITTTGNAALDAGSAGFMNYGIMVK